MLKDKIEVDQSNKVEYTKKNTVVAYSNKKQKALLIKARDKRKLKQLFREAGKPYIFVYKTFAVLIYLLIKDDLEQIESIVIDQEYQGKEPLIKDFLLQIIRKNTKSQIDRDNIWFEQIGKKSKAHEKAINTFREDDKPDIYVRYNDILPYIV